MMGGPTIRSIPLEDKDMTNLVSPDFPTCVFKQMESSLAAHLHQFQDRHTDASTDAFGPSRHAFPSAPLATPPVPLATPPAPLATPPAPLAPLPKDRNARRKLPLPHDVKCGACGFIWKKGSITITHQPV